MLLQIPNPILQRVVRQVMAWFFGEPRKLALAISRSFLLFWVTVANGCSQVCGTKVTFPPIFWDYSTRYIQVFVLQYAATYPRFQVGDT